MDNENYTYEEFIEYIETKGFAAFDYETYLQYAEEGMIENFFIHTSNFFRSMFHTTLTNTTKFWKSFKRSEIKMINQSRRASINKIHTLPYTKIANISVPIPRGMYTTYPNTHTTLVNSLRELDMPRKVVTMEGSIKRLYDGRKEEYQMKENMKHINNTTDKKVYKNLQVTLKKVDNPKYSKLEKPFGDLFTSTGELIELWNDSLRCEPIYEEFNKTLSVAQDIEKTMEKLLDDKEYSFNLMGKEDINEFSKSLFAFGEAYEFYGRLVYFLIRVQHNLVEVHKSLARATQTAW